MNSKKNKINSDSEKYKINTGSTLRKLKKPSNEQRSHVGICMGSWDSSKFEPLSFSLISARNIDHVSKSRVSSLLLARKSWDSSKFEEKLNSRQKSFEFCATSGFSSQKKWAYSGFWHVINISSRNLGETIYVYLLAKQIVNS